MMEYLYRRAEQGFVLATSLVMLVLLTTLSIAVYYGTVVSQQTSATARDATQAFYYAETGINYVAWALQNDAELDGYNPIDRPGTLPGVFTLQSAGVGDKAEWKASMGHPSNNDVIASVFMNPVIAVNDPAVNIYGQLSYFDNRDVYARPVELRGSAAGSDIYSFGSSNSPTFSDIYAQLGGYVMLSIDNYGNITPTLSAAPHAAIPDTFSGAIVWLTAGDPYTDRVLYPYDKYAAPAWDAYSNAIVTASKPLGGSYPRALGLRSNVSPYSYVDPVSPWNVPLVDAWGRKIRGTPFDPYGSYYEQIPCDLYAMDVSNAPARDTYEACQADGVWLTTNDYALAVYALGYVNGNAKKMIRMIVHF